MNDVDFFLLLIGVIIGAGVLSLLAPACITALLEWIDRARGRHG